LLQQFGPGKNVLVTTTPRSAWPGLYLLGAVWFRRSRKPKRTASEWGSTEEHRELAEVLNSVRGHVVLSGYASPEYDEWYRGWERIEFDAAMFARSDKGRSRDRRTEVLWIKPAA
jgi:hypothetical protein